MPVSQVSSQLKKTRKGEKVNWIYAVWNRCDTRRTGNHKHFTRVPVNCKAVATTCEAIVTEEAIFSAAACSYVRLTGFQRAKLQEVYLLTADGEVSPLDIDNYEKVEELVRWYKLESPKTAANGY